MEIYIQLAGVQLGPYLENKVREYLTDGLLTLSDPARLATSETWESVGAVLEKVAASAPKDASVALATTTPGSLVTTLVPASATGAPVPLSLPTSPSAAPKPLDTETAARQLVVKSLAKKAALAAKPTASQALSSLFPGAVKGPDKSTETGALPTPIKVLTKKPEPGAMPSSVASAKAPETTEKPSPQPIRVLSKKSDLEERTATPLAVAPPTESPVRPESVASAKAGEPTEKSLPQPIRVLSKKADLEEKPASPTPSALTKETSVAPEAVASAKAEVSTEKQQPQPIRVLPNKADLEEKTESTGTASTTAPLLVKVARKKNTAVTRPAPLIQLTSTAAATPPVVENVPPVETKVLPETPTPVAKDEAPPEPAKSAPFRPRPAWSWMNVVYGGVLLLLVLGLYAGSAYFAGQAFLKALHDGDEAQLAHLVDFPLVRDSLQKQMEAQLNAGTPDVSGNSTAGSPSPAVLAMIQNSINVYVTPAGISALVNKGDLGARGDQGPTVTVDVASGILQSLNGLPVQSQGLASYHEFVIDLDQVKFVFQFYGLGWRLNRVELKPNLQLPGPSGSSSASTTPPTPSASPVVSPVIETYLDQGNAKCKSGDWDGAIADFTQVLAINPKATVAYNNRAFAKQSKKDPDLAGAIADYTAAINLEPKLAATYYNRGGAELAANDPDSALADYSQSIELDPKQTGVYYARGNLRATKGDFDGAIADFTQVLDLDPNQANAYSNRGYARQAKNDLDGAIQDYSQALTIDPKIAAAYYNRGLARQAQGNVEGAILDFNQSLDLDPKMARAYYNRGNAKNTKHDLDGAIADYNQAIVLDPTIALAFCNRGLARQSKGDLDGAMADYTQALTLDPKIAVAYYNRGLIKEQKNDLDGAIADSTQALDLDPKEAQAYYNRGFAKLTKGNLAGARDDLAKFCELAPRDHFADHARLYLWLMSKAQNDKTTADSDLSNSLQSDWNSASDDLVTKIAAFLLDRMSEADLIAAAESPNVKKDQGQHCEVWYFAGMKRLLSGDPATAASYFHKCLATGEKDFCEYILSQAELQALEPAPKN